MAWTRRVLDDALEQFAALPSLDLGHNGIGDEGAGRLAEALGWNATLTSLALGYNQIGSVMSEKLAAYLKRNRVRGTTILTVTFPPQGADHCKVFCTGISGALVTSFHMEKQATVQALRSAITEHSQLGAFRLILPKTTLLNDLAVRISEFL